MSESTGIRIGGFEVIKELPGAEGGQGVLYVARCVEPQFDGVQIGDVVAIKVMTVQDSDGKLFKRLSARTTELASLQHPGILRYFGCFSRKEVFNYYHFVVMEFLLGQTLKQRIEKSPSGLDADDAIRVCLACLDALCYARQHSIVHRDLTPSNIFLCNDGAVKLIDFEVAKTMKPTEHTNSTGVFGKLDYMAPELFIGSKDTPEQSDIFSFCLCVHEAFCGKLPYEKGSVAQAKGEIKINDNIRALVPGLDDVLLKGLSPDPASRYQSFDELYAIFKDLKVNQWQGSKGKTYLALQFVGGGGFGWVYKARLQPDGDLVAIKYLLDVRFTDRFEREAETLKAFNDDRIVRFIDYFKESKLLGGHGFLVMNYLDGMPGSSLRDRLKAARAANDNKRVGLSFDEVLAAFIRYSEGLRLMHKAGVYHRDLKPANLYMPEGHPEKACIMDLGVARNEEATLTHMGNVPGTLDYMPPEFARASGGRGSAASDIYAFGLCLHEALTGRFPLPRLPAGSQAWLKYLERSVSNPPCPEFKDEIITGNEVLLQLLSRMIEPDASRRITDADQVTGCLHRLLKSGVHGESESEPLDETVCELPKTVIDEPERKEQRPEVVDEIKTQGTIALDQGKTLGTVALGGLTAGTVALSELPDDLRRHVEQAQAREKGARDVRQRPQEGVAKQGDAAKDHKAGPQRAGDADGRGRGYEMSARQRDEELRQQQKRQREEVKKEKEAAALRRRLIAEGFWIRNKRKCVVAALLVAVGISGFFSREFIGQQVHIISAQANYRLDVALLKREIQAGENKAGLLEQESVLVDSPDAFFTFIKHVDEIRDGVAQQALPKMSRPVDQVSQDVANIYLLYGVLTNRFEAIKVTAGKSAEKHATDIFRQIEMECNQGKVEDAVRSVENWKRWKVCVAESFAADQEALIEKAIKHGKIVAQQQADALKAANLAKTQATEKARVDEENRKRRKAEQDEEAARIAAENEKKAKEQKQKEQELARIAEEARIKKEAEDALALQKDLARQAAEEAEKQRLARETEQIRIAQQKKKDEDAAAKKEATRLAELERKAMVSSFTKILQGWETAITSGTLLTSGRDFVWPEKNIVEDPQVKAAAAMVGGTLLKQVRSILLVDTPLTTRSERLGQAVKLLQTETVVRLFEASDDTFLQSEAKKVKEQIQTAQETLLIEVANVTDDSIQVVAGTVSVSLKTGTKEIVKVHPDSLSKSISITARRKGYQDASQQVAVELGAAYQITFDRFLPVPVSVSIETGNDASVRTQMLDANDRAVATAAGKVSVLPGSYKVFFEKDDWVRQTVTLLVKVGQSEQHCSPEKWKKTDAALQLDLAEKALHEKQYDTVIQTLKKATPLFAKDNIQRYQEVERALGIYFQGVADQYVKAVRTWKMEEVLRTFQIADVSTLKLRNETEKFTVEKPKKPMIPESFWSKLEPATRNGLTVAMSDSATGILGKESEALLQKCKELYERVLLEQDATYPQEWINGMHQLVEAGYIPNSFDLKLIEEAIKRCETHCRAVVASSRMTDGDKQIIREKTASLGLKAKEIQKARGT